jgi:hypothetical protein
MRGSVNLIPGHCLMGASIPDAIGTLFGAAALAIFLTVNAASCAAEVFRWQDEQGRTHYGDRPPDPAAQRIDMLPEPPPDPHLEERRERRNRLLDIFSEDRAAADQLRQQDTEERLRLRRACTEAGDLLIKVQQAAALQEPGEDPENPRILSDEERARYTAELEARVRRLCQ